MSGMISIFLFPNKIDEAGGVGDPYFLKRFLGKMKLKGEK